MSTSPSSSCPDIRWRHPVHDGHPMGCDLRRPRPSTRTAHRNESVAGHAARSKLSCRVRQRRRHEARHEDGRTPEDEDDEDGAIERLRLQYPTHGPKNRYRNVLFLEKEGFNDLLAAAEIAERFDLAIMSTKGYSSTAARTLVEALDGVRIFVLHDFDKDGLGICYTLHHDTIRYQFAQPPKIIDLGIRLEDVRSEGLQSEPVAYGRDPSSALRRYGATWAEIDMLQEAGERVELNAFTSDQFIGWLERKLVAHKVKKVIPETATLEDAYRRAVMLHQINVGLEELEEEARKKADAVKIPRTLEKQIAARLKKDPTLAWDMAVADITERVL